jgi:putative FmdB family regulatory protein
MIEIQYECTNCKHKFKEITPETVIKAKIPSCPACRNTDTTKVVMVNKTADKIDNS